MLRLCGVVCFITFYADIIWLIGAQSFQPAVSKILDWMEHIIDAAQRYTSSAYSTSQFRCVPFSYNISTNWATSILCCAIYKKKKTTWHPSDCCIIIFFILLVFISRYLLLLRCLIRWTWSTMFLAKNAVSPDWKLFEMRKRNNQHPYVYVCELNDGGSALATLSSPTYTDSGRWIPIRFRIGTHIFTATDMKNGKANTLTGRDDVRWKNAKYGSSIIFLSFFVFLFLRCWSSTSPQTDKWKLGNDTKWVFWSMTIFSILSSLSTSNKYYIFILLLIVNLVQE